MNFVTCVVKMNSERYTKLKEEHALKCVMMVVEKMEDHGFGSQKLMLLDLLKEEDLYEICFILYLKLKKTFS